MINTRSEILQVFAPNGTEWVLNFRNWAGFCRRDKKRVMNLNSDHFQAEVAFYEIFFLSLLGKSSELDERIFCNYNILSET